MPDPQAELPAFQRLVVGLAPQLGGLVRESGRALPGATEALTALAALADGRGLGRARRAGPGAAGAVGADRQHAGHRAGQAGRAGPGPVPGPAGRRYGDAHEIRADLVPLARARAAAAYGGDFAGRATVLIGDTPLDIEAARLAGARSVGVATGGFSPAELAAAGADAVLPDLTDTDRVLAAIVPAAGRTLPSGDV